MARRTGAAILFSLLLIASPAESSFRDLPRSAEAYALAIQPDGKVVAAGATRSGAHSAFALARYGLQGRLDATFGRGGKVVTDFGAGSAGAAAVALQSDDKIVAAGWSEAEGRKDFALARYGTGGRLDPSFGRGGKVLTDVGSFDEVFAIGIQRDGKIVVAGSSGLRKFALARYTVRGHLDRSFGEGGIVVTRFDRRYNAFARGVAVEPDGKIVAIGACCLTGWALVRYNVDGSLDRAFGQNGKQVTRFPISQRGAADDAHALALQPDGRILGVGGGATFALARYTSEGALDEGFGNGGIARTAFASIYNADAGAEAALLQTDKKIVAAGWNQISGDDVRSPADFALARYSSAGELDPTFGRHGKVLTRFGVGKSAFAHAVAVQANGRIVAAGRCMRDFALARYTTRGRLDGSFGSRGKVLTDFGSG